VQVKGDKVVDTRKDNLGDLFSVYAIRKSEPTPMILTNLHFGRLMDDVVVPFESEGAFFVDGYTVKATDLDRIKIIRQDDDFSAKFYELHYVMRRGELKQQELYAKQYHIRMEALLRESGDDVTAQVLNAYRTVIKPKLKDYLPEKQTLIDATVKVFVESLKLLSAHNS
jgi:hypothetical protein